MTHEQFKKRWTRLSAPQQWWVRRKAEWEQRSLSAIIEEYGIPPRRDCERMMIDVRER